MRIRQTLHKFFHNADSGILSQAAKDVLLLSAGVFVGMILAASLIAMLGVR